MELNGTILSQIQPVNHGFCLRRLNQLLPYVVISTKENHNISHSTPLVPHTGSTLPCLLKAPERLCTSLASILPSNLLRFTQTEPTY